MFSLQDIVIETMLGGDNIVQGPPLLKLLFVDLQTMFPFRFILRKVLLFLSLRFLGCVLHIMIVI